MTLYRDFPAAIRHFHAMMKEAPQTQRGKWQGVDVSKKPDMSVYELLYMTMKVPMTMSDLHSYRVDIKPNLPWADNHFAERVSGNPLNPGEEWARWPWGKNADKFRVDPQSIGDPGPDPVFDHTYMQRYWPKQAGMVSGGVLSKCNSTDIHKGIYFEYGDLDDVVAELVDDPTTRQAILPVFFPEDTGLRPGRRKPCSLFYHFMLTADKKLGIEYSLRSCDLVRHFRDDIYLTVRLLLWVLEQCAARDSFWRTVVPGAFVMHIGNLHCFANDVIKLRNGEL